MSDTFVGCLDASAARWPEREALVIGAHRLTFNALVEQSTRLAAAWLALGVRPGDRVGLWLENGPEWAIAFWSLARIGAAAVPFNTRWTASEARFVLDQAPLAALLVGDRFRKVAFLELLAAATGTPDGSACVPRVVTTAEAAPQGVVRFAELMAMPCDERARRRVAEAQAAVQGEQVGLIQFTSGSTAFPKGAMLRQRPMVDYVREYGARMGVTPADRVLCPMPFFHIAGINHVLLVPAVQGATVITADGFDPAVTLRQMEAERCTVFGGVATMYFMLADRAPEPRRAFARIAKGWILGSAQANRKAHDLTGVAGLVSFYGATEMSGSTAVGDVRDPLDLRLARAGRSLPGMETRIVDPESGLDLPTGSVGEIWQRGWRVMAGYYGLPRAQWGIDDAGWFHSGDLGSLDEHGYLAFEGRAKDMLKVGGENVACPEVEDVLMTHESVRLAAVVGVPDARLEEVPVAFVEPRAGAAPAPDALAQHCARYLAAFKLPRRIFVLEALPMTASNKIHKPALRERALQEMGAMP